MLNIAICDDTRKDADMLRNAVEQVLFSKVDFKIVIYEDSSKMMEDIEEDRFPYVLLFLDINMPQQDGISVARYIRDKEMDVDIIFYTISAEHIFAGYAYRAFSYLMKPLDVSVLEKELGRYLEEKSTASNSLNVNIHGSRVRIPLEKVLYFASQGRKIHAIMADRTSITFYEKMGMVYSVVEEEGFIRCHQSYIVNSAYIHSYNQNTIVMQNGCNITISRAFQRIVREKLDALGSVRRNDLSIQITRSLVMNQERAGSIVFLKGEYLGTMLKMESGEVINVGRNPSACNVVYETTDISRRHCSVRYGGNGLYYVKDSSKNGTFVSGERLLPEKEYELPAKSVLVLGKSSQELLLG